MESQRGSWLTKVYLEGWPLIWHVCLSRDVSAVFLTCVSHTAHIIDIGWTSVCPSVCLSVTRWYCVETVKPIVKLSSLPSSPMILVATRQPCGAVLLRCDAAQRRDGPAWLAWVMHSVECPASSFHFCSKISVILSLLYYFDTVCSKTLLQQS